MTSTPENKVKHSVNRVIAKFGGRIYRFMPVPYGYGASSLDYLLCVGGKFVAIETKAPGATPTPRQHSVAAKIKAAGGKVFFINGTDEKGMTPIAELEWFLAENVR